MRCEDVNSLTVSFFEIRRGKCEYLASSAARAPGARERRRQEVPLLYPAGPLPTSGTGKTETSCRRMNGERFAALREKFPNWGAALNRNKCLALARPLLYGLLRGVH